MRLPGRLQPITSNTRAALVAFTLITVLVAFTHAPWRQTDLSCTAVKLALGTLSYLGVATWQAIHAYPCARAIFDALQHLSGALGPHFVKLSLAIL